MTSQPLNARGSRQNSPADARYPMPLPNPHHSPQQVSPTVPPHGQQHPHQRHRSSTYNERGLFNRGNSAQHPHLHASSSSSTQYSPTSPNQSPIQPPYSGQGRPPMPHQYSSAPTLIPNHNGTASYQRPGPPAPPATYYPQHSDQVDHASPNRAHNTEDCPGCQADFEAALRASQASALQEARRREELRAEDEEHRRAVRASEEEEKKRQQAEEEEIRKVMQASQRDEEEAQRRRQQKQREEEEHRQILLEESRQSALREDEERISRAHAEVLERSRREAEELARRRQQEEEEMQAIEAAAIEESRRQMEEEWRRRDEEERAMQEFARRGGVQGEAAYWQHLRQDQAYDLALEMNRSLSVHDHPSSSRLSRRPLPQTPGLAALAAGVESRTQSEGNDGEVWDHPDDGLAHGTDEDDDDVDPFGDQAEALPTYEEVRTDRPPEAPDSIPEHVRFAPPPEIVQPVTTSQTLALPSQRPEKSAVSPSTTPRPIQRELPPVASSSALDSSGQHLAARPVLAHSPVSPPPAVPSPDRVGSSERQTSRKNAPAPVLERNDSNRSSASSVQHTSDYESRRDSASTVQSTDTSSRVSLLRQRAMKGTDFGYSTESFSPHLFVYEDDEDKKNFPPLIQLKAQKAERLLRERNGFFVLRAPSWKMLLRALAWYGNTRIEAGPEEVADASGPLKLRLEVEFVTPTKVELTPGNPKLKGGSNNAYVSVCMSLFHSQLSQSASSTLSSQLKKSSRALDASFLRAGSTRRVITLPTQAPSLPLTMVRLAQHLHQAHVFSAACPSTSQTALHSPRDLTQAVDRHDMRYMAKLQRARKDAAALTQASAEASTGGQQGTSAGKEEPEEDMFDAGAVEDFDEGDVSASTMSRMKARMKRKLAKRSGETNAVDQDLESWITPFDVNQHG